jgi:hypothetical protein
MAQNMKISVPYFITHSNGIYDRLEVLGDENAFIIKFSLDG